MQMMKEGAKWELYIKSELGYGDRGAGGLIPGGSVLIFEMGKCSASALVLCTANLRRVSCALKQALISLIYDRTSQGWCRHCLM